MSLPMPPNVIVDIYRGCTPSQALPGGSPALIGVPGFLQPVVQTGRHGTANYLKWTHILYLDAAVDIRDAYNGQANSETIANADTVVLENKTSFVVVYVELALRSTPNVHIRAYLDRLQPSAWPTEAT